MNRLSSGEASLLLAVLYATAVASLSTTKR